MRGAEKRYVFRLQDVKRRPNMNDLTLKSSEMEREKRRLRRRRPRRR